MMKEFLDDRVRHSSIATAHWYFPLRIRPYKKRSTTRSTARSLVFIDIDAAKEREKLVRAADVRISLTASSRPFETLLVVLDEAPEGSVEKR